MLLGEKIRTIRENTDVLLFASKESGLEVNAEKTKSMFMFSEQSASNVKISNTILNGHDSTNIW
jgi:hypothetical protein